MKRTPKLRDERRLVVVADKSKKADKSGKPERFSTRTKSDDIWIYTLSVV